MANQDSGHMIRSGVSVMFRIIVAALRVVVRSSLRSGLPLVMSLHYLDRNTDHHCAGVVPPPRPPRPLHLLPGALVPDAESGGEIRIGKPHNVIHTHVPERGPDCRPEQGRGIPERGPEWPLLRSGAASRSCSGAFCDQLG